MVFKPHLLISRKVRYTLFGVVMALFVAGNVFVHVLSMQMSDKALEYERTISTLKQENLVLEDELASSFSLQKVAAVAESEGYKSGGTAARWAPPVVAAR